MQTYEQVAPAALPMAAARLYNHGERPLTAMFANDERTINGTMAIYCIFADSRQGCYQTVKVSLAEQPWQFPSLVSITPAAAWYEREIHDLFGIVPVGHPDLRPLVLHENWPEGLYPLRKDFRTEILVPVADKEYVLPAVKGEGIFEVPVGPIHAGIIEPGHFRFSQAGEHMIKLEAKLFFTHRGIEKSVEGIPLERAFYQIERICGACTVSHALSFSQAIESMVQMTISRQAQYIRVLAAELERLYNHVGDTGNLCAGMGFAVGISQGSRLKEILMNLNERLAGNRFLRGIITPGGVNIVLTKAIADDILATLATVEEEFNQLVELLQDSEAFADRVNTTGVLSRQAALELAVVGVAARASGVNCDSRRDSAYGVYRELDFKVPVYTTGDVAARLWVRVEEVQQSMSMIRQVLSAMPGSQAKSKEAIGPLVPYTYGMGWSESARGQNIHWVMVGENNEIYRLFVRSASYPNWPAVTVAAIGNIIPDFPLINKSFELCYACIDR